MQERRTQKESIRIGNWVIREKNQGGRWKASGPDGNFTLHQIDAITWRYIFGRSSEKSQARRQINACGVEEAALTAIEILFGRSIAPLPARLDVADVLRHGWEDSQAEPYYRKKLAQFSGYFLDWCIGEGVYYWDELLARRKPSDYVSHLAQRRLRRSSMSHYLEPVKRAASWASTQQDGRIRDWFQGYRLPPRVGLDLRYNAGAALKYLPFETIFALLEWMRDYRQGLSLRPGVALQALTALQLQEATRLTWDKVDLEDGTITIESDRRRDPLSAGIKNQWRVRRLPIPSLVHEILLETYQRQGSPAGSELVIDCPSWGAYSSRMDDMFNTFNQSLSIPPSDLRNTLPTEAENGRWLSVWVRRYMGHAPANEIERSYLGINSVEGLKEGADPFVERLRQKVVVHIEDAIREWKSKVASEGVARIGRDAA